jgi:hypothetical protein
LFGLQERAPKASTGSWFQSCMVMLLYIVNIFG